MMLPVGTTKRIVSPVGGLNYRDSDAAMKTTDALLLDNLFPNSTDCTLRGGQANHVTGFAAQVKTLLPYSSPSANKLFAATDSGIYEATTAGVVGAAVHTVTVGDLQYTQQTTAAGAFLVAVNGTDKLALYTGSAWVAVDGSSTPAITGVTTTTIVNVSVHAQRLFFVVNNSTTLYYLPVDSVGGAASSLAVGSYFNKGGYIVATGSWTRDGGNGPDDLFAAITSIGEVALFSGTDPSSPTTWSHVGTFFIGQPISRKCFAKQGGELLVLTKGGVFPMSRALDKAELGSQFAVTNKIDSYYKYWVDLYGTLTGWQVVPFPEKGMLLISFPTGATDEAFQLVQNVATGSWCRFTGIGARCMAVLAGQLYTGMSTKVVKALTGHTDFGANVIGRVQTAYLYLDKPTIDKHVTYIRTVFLAGNTVNASFNLLTDFEDATTVSTLSFSASSIGVWGTGVWGTAVWGGSFSVNEWVHTPSNPGRCFSLQMQIGCSSELKWKATDFLYREGRGRL
jgi:uncharacterized membrane protein YeaQ/YmgE (transglycosylase-associated protein family)